MIFPVLELDLSLPAPLGEHRNDYVSDRIGHIVVPENACYCSKLLGTSWYLSVGPTSGLSEVM